MRRLRFDLASLALQIATEAAVALADRSPLQVTWIDLDLPIELAIGGVPRRAERLSFQFPVRFPSRGGPVQGRLRIRIEEGPS